MTVREALREAAGALAGAGIVGAGTDACLLMAHALGDTPGHLPVRMRQELGAAELAGFRELVARRGGREPLAYVTGETEFMGLRFHCDARALVPRPDTEVLVEAVLARAPRGELLVAEIGTGTGCIAVSLAHFLPRARVVATDASSEALALAAANVALNGLQARVALLEGYDLGPLEGAGLLGQVGVLVSNPPYIPDAEVPGLEPEVSAAEPRLALCGGPDGLDWYRRVLPRLAGLPRLELVGLEFGVGQAEALLALAAGALPGWRLEVTCDLAGLERAVTARRPG
jgi:release factor glutamine methyltransferase